MRQDRLSEIVKHLQAAADLAKQEAKEQKELRPMAQAFREAAQQRSVLQRQWEHIGRIFNALTAYLLDAGMPLQSGNEIHVPGHTSWPIE